MRAIDVHVHPMTKAYVDAAAPFMGAAERMFPGKFAARTEESLAEDFRRADMLAMAIGSDARNGMGGIAIPNDDIAALTTKFPDVFLPGWAMVDPWQGRAGLEEIERCIKVLGMKGVKYQPPMQAFTPSDRRFYPIWDLMQSLGAPVLIHTGTTAIGTGEPGGLGIKLEYGRPIPGIDSVAADFPKLTIVAAHPGWPWTEELIAIAIHKSNVFIDISGWTPKYVPPALKHDMNRRLQDKIVFGSDYPGWNPGQMADEWEMEGLKPQVLEKLYTKNVLRALGLDAAVATALKAQAARKAK